MGVSCFAILLGLVRNIPFSMACSAVEHGCATLVGKDFIVSWREATRRSLDLRCNMSVRVCMAEQDQNIVL
jgi:hypothetical protein